jgi:hypothetical protein
MAEYNFVLRGWKAVAVLALIVGISGFRFISRFQAVDDAGRDVLTAWLLKDYNGQGQRDLMKRVQDYKARLPMQPITEIKPMNIEFASLSAHGLRDAMVAKAQITVEGGTPPDGRSVRYFYLTRNVDGAWTVFTETDEYCYYRALWR